jgi:hypothetical protein
MGINRILAELRAERDRLDRAIAAIEGLNSTGRRRAGRPPRARLREQIEAGFGENLPLRAIEASCFPWGRRSSWESCATDECIRLLSLGHFSHTELVRSFVRTDAEPLPTIYELRTYSGDEGRQTH